MNTPSFTVKKLVVGQMGVNCYLVIDQRSGEGLIIDPGDEADYISGEISKLNIRPVLIAATHGHFDHLLAASALQLIYAIPFCIHKDDAFLVARMRESAKYFLGHDVAELPPQITQILKPHEAIHIGDTTITIVHTPGHTPGGICLMEHAKHVIFVGDTIFAGGGVGRTDFSYSDRQKLQKSIRTILSFEDTTILYPGHGDETTVKKEKSTIRI
jgi:hydroxyacylglutathione hydrolase